MQGASAGVKIAAGPTNSRTASRLSPYTPNREAAASARRSARAAHSRSGSTGTRSAHGRAAILGESEGDGERERPGRFPAARSARRAPKPRRRTRPAGGQRRHDERHQPANRPARPGRPRRPNRDRRGNSRSPTSSRSGRALQRVRRGRHGRGRSRRAARRRPKVSEQHRPEMRRAARRAPTAPRRGRRQRAPPPARRATHVAARGHRRAPAARGASAGARGAAASGARCRASEPPSASPARRRRWMRTRLIRRGSASSTSNSRPLGWRISSPRAGTRPARVKTRPPSVSMSSSCSSAMRSRPSCFSTLDLARARRRSGRAVGVCADHAARPRRRARPRCRRRPSSTRSSIETRPSVPPYSSMTRAMCVRVACIRSRRSSAGIEWRHEQDRAQDVEPRRRSRAGRPCRDRSAARRRPSAAVVGSQAMNPGIADVDHAAWVVERLADRPAGANGRPCGTGAAARRGSRRRQRATMSARGTMTSSTARLPKPSMFLSIARSCGEKSCRSCFAQARPRGRRADRTRAPRPKRWSRRSNQAPRSRSDGFCVGTLVVGFGVVAHGDDLRGRRRSVLGIRIGDAECAPAPDLESLHHLRLGVRSWS